MAIERYLIRGTLQTISPLAIGDGQTWADTQQYVPTASQRPHSCCYSSLPKQVDPALVARDLRGLPYVPGSALKGVLKRQLARHHGLSPATQNTMWGTESVVEDTGQGGTVHCYDARIDERWLLPLRASQPMDWGNHLPWWNPERLSYVETAVAINPLTGTADDHTLRYLEVVPADVLFRAEFMIDVVRGDAAKQAEHQRQMVEWLLEALDGFNLDPHDGPVQLGSQSSNGWGRCRWALEEVRRWKAGTPRDEAVHDTVLVDNQLTKSANRAAQARSLTPAPATGATLTLDLELHFDGPCLVNDPSRNATGDDHGRKIDHYPRHTTRPPAAHPSESQDADQGCYPLLPAASVRGALRNQLNKIITVLYAHDQSAGDDRQLLQTASQIARGWLGETDQASAFWISDFVSMRTYPIHCQEMIATDRFTGGVSGGKKFSVHHFQSPVLSGHLSVKLPMATDRAQRLIGLTALLLRDLMEGDIHFGFGSRRGFGECRGVITGAWIRGGGQSAGLWQSLDASDCTDDDALDQLIAAIRTDEELDDTQRQLRERLDHFLNTALAAVRATTDRLAHPERPHHDLLP